MTRRQLPFGNQHHHGHGRRTRRNASGAREESGARFSQLFLEMMLDPGKLEDFRVRDFSPTLQGWVEQEPLGYLDGLNAYAFVNDESAQPVPRMNDGACGTRCAGGTLPHGSV